MTNRGMHALCQLAEPNVAFSVTTELPALHQAAFLVPRGACCAPQAEPPVAVKHASCDHKANLSQVLLHCDLACSQHPHPALHTTISNRRPEKCLVV